MYPFQLFIRLLIKYQSPLKEVLLYVSVDCFPTLIVFYAISKYNCRFSFFFNLKSWFFSLGNTMT